MNNRKKKPTEYLAEALRYKPDATGRELRLEVRRLLKRDGYGAGWIMVIIKILVALAPLLFQRPKS